MKKRASAKKHSHSEPKRIPKGKPHPPAHEATPEQLAKALLRPWRGPRR